jgi:hypothetical protein
MRRTSVDEIRELGADDVPSLVSCIRACYGDSYSEPDFYDVGYLEGELAAGRLLSVGAFVGSTVVGHVGTRMLGPSEPVADTIGGVVHPDHRGTGLTAAMGARMVAGYPDRGIVGARHVATGAHDRTQRLLVASGAVATGVLLGHVPASIDYRGIAHGFSDRRVGAVVYYQGYGRLDPLDVFVPDRYDVVGDLYAELQLERRVLAAAVRRPSSEWSATVTDQSDQGIVTIRFGALDVGAPLSTNDALAVASGRSAAVVYADLPLADPRTPATVDELHAEGFRFGALLPGAATSETLRLQRVDPHLVAPEAIVTASPGGRALLALVSSS